MPGPNSTNLGMIMAIGSDTVDVTNHIVNNLTSIDNTFNSHTPTTIAVGDSAAMGTSLIVARGDHRHGAPAFGAPVALGTAIATGTSANINHSDHVHTIGVGTVDTASLGAGLAVPLTKIDINGGTDIGAALADGDLLPVYDLSATANKKAALSRVATYIESAITGDVTISAHVASIAAGAIVNADISSSAAIAATKLARWPTVQVSKTADQALTVSGTWYTLTWDAEAFDTDTFHDNVTNNTRLTLPYSGLYLIWTNTWFAAAAGGTQRNTRILLNGSNQINVFGDNYGGAGAVTIHNQTVYIRATAGQYFEVEAMQDSGGAVNIVQYSNCTIIYLGA